MKQNPKSTFALIGVAAFALAQPALTPAANLVQYWHFEEVGATIVSNALPGGNLGRLMNVDTNVCWLSGDVPYQLTNSTASIILDGTNNYIDLGNVHLLDYATLSLWVKPTAYVADMRLFNPFPAPSPYGGVIRFDPYASGYVQVNNGGAWINLGLASTVPAGVWTHLAFTYGNGVVSMYANGVWAGTAPAIFPFDQTEFGLGQIFNTSGKYFSGAFDEVSFWDGPLNTNSIALLAAGVPPTAIADPPPPTPPPAKLVQYFPLDDGPGSSTASNGVASGNLGALVNFDPGTAWVTNGLPPKLARDAAALAFNSAVSNRVDLGSFGLAGAGTISLWMKPATNGGDMRIFSQTTGGTGLPGSIGFVGVGGLQCWNGAAWMRVAPDGAIPTNQWTHLALTYSRGAATAFVNGVPQISSRAGFFFTTDNCGLGALFQLASGKPFNGLLDDVAVWDQALSAGSIAQLAAGVSPLSIVDVPASTPPIALTSIIVTGAPPKLTQYFPLEAAAGSTSVTNAVVGGNTGSLVNYTNGAPSWVTTDLCPRLPNSTSALFMDGLTNYANLGNLGLSGSATVSFWAKPATLAPIGANVRRLFSPIAGTSAQQGALGVNGDGSVWVSTAGGLVATFGQGALATNQWFHLAVTYSSGLATLYVDGVQLGTTIAGFGFTNAAGLGSRFATYGSTFSGLMDDVAIWNAPLSPASIQQLANGASPLTVGEAGNKLVLSWPAYPGAFILQTTDDLAHGWSTVNWPVVLSNTTYSVTLSVSTKTPRQFYRLKQL